MTVYAERTPEEIEALKADWERDPCWDIEYTEGFEAHRDELRAWSEHVKARWAAAEQQRLKAEATRRGLSPGVVQRIEGAQSTSRDRADDAVRYLAHLLRAAGVDYPDLEADVGSVIYHVRLAAVGEAKAEMEPRLSALEAKADELEPRIAALEAKADEIEPRLAALEARVQASEEKG